MINQNNAPTLLGMAAIVVTLGIGTCSTNTRIDDGFANVNRRIDDGFANVNRRIDDGFANVNRPARRPPPCGWPPGQRHHRAPRPPCWQSPRGAAAFDGIASVAGILHTPLSRPAREMRIGERSFDQRTSAPSCAAGACGAGDRRGSSLGLGSTGRRRAAFGDRGGGAGSLGPGDGPAVASDMVSVMLRRAEPMRTPGRAARASPWSCPGRRSPRAARRSRATPRAGPSRTRAILVSDHPKWEPVPWPERAKVVGEVVWVARGLI